MWRKTAVLAAAAALSFVMFGGIGAPRGTLASSQPFTFNWAGTPAAPMPWRPADWDVLVHQRQTDITFPATVPTTAQHGANCAAPPATHPVTTAPDSVFICNNHLMTSINGADYGLIYITPSQEVDFAGGASVTYSQSTLRTSLRDWTDIWITPFGENLVAPLDSYLPDLEGTPRDAVHIEMNQFNGGTIFIGSVIKNFVETDLPHDWTTLDQILSGSATTRTGYELDLSPTHIRFGIPSLNHWWIDTNAQVPFTRGIVQIGHHSYNPTKDCGVGASAPVAGCPPNTWHWSNFGISDAVPFTMLKPDVTDFVGPRTVNFATSAPSGAFLRFHALGTGIQVSLNGGPYLGATEAQELGQNGAIHDEHFKDYWMAIPAGTTTVAFRGKPWPGGDTFRVQDVSIWSESGVVQNPGTTGSPSPSPSPSPAVTPSPTPTPSQSLPMNGVPCTVTINGVRMTGTCTGMFHGA